MPRVSLTCNDTFLFGALGYSMVVLVIKWNKYGECEQPLQLFLLVDYATIILFRISHFVSQYYSQRYPPSELPPRIANFVKIGVMFTFFIIWTIVGTVWFAQSEGNCLPESNQYWTMIIWLVLCYIWIVVYSCLLYAQYSIRRGRRWGVGAGVAMQPRVPAYHGLKEEEILRIPVFFAAKESEENALCNQQCCICLDPLGAEMGLKRLPGCEHLYHALCIDPWLQTHSTCPYCRLDVKPPAEGTTSSIPREALMSPAERQARMTMAQGRGSHMNGHAQNQNQQNQNAGQGTVEDAQRNAQLRMMDIGELDEENPADGSSSHRSHHGHGAEEATTPKSQNGDGYGNNGNNAGDAVIDVGAGAPGNQESPSPKNAVSIAHSQSQEDFLRTPEPRESKKSVVDANRLGTDNGSDGKRNGDGNSLAVLQSEGWGASPMSHNSVAPVSQADVQIDISAMAAEDDQAGKGSPMPPSSNQ